jgi:hypothetical protein
MNAKRLALSCLAAAAFFVLLASVPAEAAITIDFEAVALRGANAVPHVMPAVTEYTNGNGMSTSSLVGGQKVYYGTSYFNGMSVGDLRSVSFKYKPASVDGPNPYLNLLITNGTDFGVIGQGTGTRVDEGGGVFSMYYDFTNYGLSRNGYGFYEGVGTPLTTTTWDDVSSYNLLGVGATRPLSYGESTDPANLNPGPRASQTDALTILWGDSAENYLGAKDVYDVVVVTSDGTYVAGTPEPATVLVWSLLGMVAAGYGVWRRRRAA